MKLQPQIASRLVADAKLGETFRRLVERQRRIMNLKAEEELLFAFFLPWHGSYPIHVLRESSTSAVDKTITDSGSLLPRGMGYWTMAELALSIISKLSVLCLQGPSEWDPR